MAKKYTSGINLFHPDHLYLTDDSEIKENTETFKEGFNGDWYYNTIHNSISRIGDITKYDYKIIFSTNPDLNLPLIELPEFNKDEEIKQKFKKATINFKGDDSEYSKDFYNVCESVFIEGAKLNPFGEQDMKNAFIAGSKIDTKSLSLIKLKNEKIDREFKSFIASKAKKIQSLEIDGEDVLLEPYIDNNNDLRRNKFEWQPKLVNGKIIPRNIIYK